LLLGYYKVRLNSGRGVVRFTTNGAGHQYNELTTEVTRQMKGGLYLQSSWTWARDIYDLNSGGTPENSF